MLRTMNVFPIISGGSSLQFAPSFYHVLPKPAAAAKVANLTPQTEPSGTKAEVTPSKPPAAVVLKSTGNQHCKSGNISKLNPGKNLFFPFFFFVLAGQKKRRRRNRWSSGICVKRKHASPHTSREDAHLATDEEEEDGDDEDAERGGRDKQVEAETEKLTATGNKIVNVEEEEPAQMATPGTRRAVREDPGTGEMVSSHDSNEKLMEFCVRISERLARGMTRAKKNVMMQQQRTDVDSAVEQETPPLVVDRNKLKVCWSTAELVFSLSKSH